jgi:hypothetical protein
MATAEPVEENRPIPPILSTVGQLEFKPKSLVFSSLIPRLAAFRDRSPWRFWLVMNVERSIVMVLGMVLLGWLAPDLGHRTDLDPISDGELLLLGIVIAPLIETLLCQSLPCALARRFKGNFTIQLLVCWWPFALGHLPSGLGSFLCAGIVLGYYIALTYVRLRTVSFGTAYWLTCATHAISNSLAVALIILGRYLN